MSSDFDLLHTGMCTVDVWCVLCGQVYVYNEEVVGNSIRPSLVDLFLDVARNIDDKVGALVLSFLEIKLGN